MKFTPFAAAAAAFVSLVAAQRSDEASAAKLGPAAACQPYGLPAIQALQAAGAFPAIWEIANMSTATAADLAIFTALNSSIPAIAPRGTPAGDFSGVTYDGNVDADCWWTWKQCTTPKLAGLQDDITRCPEPNTWGFTLDDGPNCSHNAYYDYLLSINQRATLFYIGSNVLDWPLEAQRGLDDGHEICAHTWSHRYMTSLTNEQVFAELYYSKKALKDVLGITVQCWRPPYGDVDDRVRYIAQALGLATVVWLDNTFDYLIATTNKTYIDNNYNAIFAKQAAGDYNTAGTIVLQHELNNFTMQEGESFLPEIQARFAHVMPIAVCNNNSNPYVESGYSYPNFEQWASGTRTIAVATATAVSVDASISLPVSAGHTGSVFVTLAYAEGAATVGASTADSGAGQGVTGVITTAVPTSTSTSSSSSSSSSTSVTTKPSSASTTFAATGALTAVITLLGGLLAGAALL